MKESEIEYCYICLVLLSALAVNPYTDKDVYIRKGPTQYKVWYESRFSVFTGNFETYTLPMV